MLFTQIENLNDKAAVRIELACALSVGGSKVCGAPAHSGGFLVMLKWNLISVNKKGFV